ncbi:Guanine nucleotide exchange factor for Cdc42p [Marasmius tenuissimus]|uniref:Guanine nucleotide exchange factor for Cdc42p n=1 Tax=Marasmius tenuissimus TaxID=585030 RepID=A0ABR3AFG3_9AGAR|nr:Guanine nucleotide exchange factor for Cdc42p [Marasmius tenuissimus]
MASVAGRKKSIVSGSGLHIDTPVANNTLLNQAAITSLYQECSRLKARLMRLRGFNYYFSLVAAANARQSTDPVTQLWDLFSYGIPLCYIFDLLPEGFNKINNSEFDQTAYDANPDRLKKHAIALFSMQIKNITDRIPEVEQFMVTDLWNRNSTDGLVKVIKTVKAIVDRIPEDAWEEAPPETPYMSSHDSRDSLVLDSPGVPSNARENARNNIVREIVETERKYVQDLEIMQKYATALAQSNIIDQDTIHFLFPNLNKLLNFQRKFLIRLESTAELPWQDQRWGQHFLESEDEFVVYEPYCANYTAASELMLTNEQSLSALNHLINVKGELPAFLIKPIQRVCKYPLLLDSLIKASSDEDYPHLTELKDGSEAAKRITDKINEAQRQAENELTVKNLQSRVEDWKGHHLENFGQLLLDDIFTVTKSDIDREYHVFLFEKIILCCKEALPAPPNGRKVSKSNSILKKQSTSMPLTPGIPGQPQKKNTPLLLKGRIFLGNVTQAVPTPSRNSTSSGIPTQYPLAVWWKGDDDLEYFTLRCKREDQMRQWESTINRLIRESAQRRASERGMPRVINNSTNPRLDRTTTNQQYPLPTQNITNIYNRNRSDSNYDREQPLSAAPFGSGPQGYPPHDAFESEADEDDYEDYPPSAYGTSSRPSSGRGTPVSASRRGPSGLPPERTYSETTDPYNRPTMHPPSLRPTTPRLTSNMSTNSDPSFARSRPQPPPLRSQFSSAKLKTTTESGDYRNGIPPTPAPISRSRSASQPQAYVPKSVPPPLPTSQWDPRLTNSSISSSKRGSGSSQSTGDSSDYSPNSSSPITPYGSSESSLGLRTSRSQVFDGAGGRGQPVKVKVHFHEDIFVIQVSRVTEYEDLVEKVGRKIRLCGPRRDDGPLRVKYMDEEGDMISLGSTEDVQMAFEQYRPGGQVTLYVT